MRTFLIVPIIVLLCVIVHTIGFIITVRILYDPKKDNLWVVFPAMMWPLVLIGIPLWLILFKEHAHGRGHQGEVSV